MIRMPYGVSTTNTDSRFDDDYSSELVPGYGTDDMIRINDHRDINEAKPIVRFDGPADYFAQRLFNTRMSLR